MKNIDSHTHVRGESVFVDDISLLQGTLHAYVVGSPVANGIIKEIDFTEVEQSVGVYSVITADDIPGDNQIGGIIQDEPLLATKHVHFKGQPIAVILATTHHNAKVAAEKCKFDIEEYHATVDPREAYNRGEIIGSPRMFVLGDCENTWEKCEEVIEGRVDIAGQEHLYLETQGAYAFSTEDDKFRIISSTQGPTAVQRTAAKILGLPMHKIEVDVRRLGGGFGGKEDQATPYACMAVLGAQISGKPVKLILDREDDLMMTGKRHPYSADYKLGLGTSGKILAYEVTFYQNAGAAADLSPAVLERTLFHCTNSYFIPNVTATGISCRTNILPNTAFRGFGGPQGMFVIEAALAKAADKLGMAQIDLQERNLLQDGDIFPYGQKVDKCMIKASWSDAVNRYELTRLRKEIDQFNATYRFKKKGIAMMPVTFGISFTNTSLNQAGALVHVYQDGSVGLSTGAVEMGQGVNTRLLQVPMRVFSLPQDKVIIETTNTTRVANTSPSAASSTHDLNGKATEMACLQILNRLHIAAAKYLEVDDHTSIEIKDEIIYHNSEPTDLTWDKLIDFAYWERVDLSAHARYATPNIYFDNETEKGHPFAYHSYGTAIVVVTVDCIRGNYQFDSVQVTHDFGKSMNPIIDLGQMEGGIVQGLGWMTSEELSYAKDGTLISNTLSTYKIPDIYAAPKVIDTHFLDISENEYGLFKSKAIGEPPLMYGIGGYFAIRDAISNFNDNSEFTFTAPYTPERVLLDLYKQDQLTDHREKLDRHITAD